jgi:hypothetical protein
LNFKSLRRAAAFAAVLGIIIVPSALVVASLRLFPRLLRLVPSQTHIVVDQLPVLAERVKNIHSDRLVLTQFLVRKMVHPKVVHQPIALTRKEPEVLNKLVTLQVRNNLPEHLTQAVNAIDGDIFSKGLVAKLGKSDHRVGSVQVELDLPVGFRQG